MSVIRIKGGLGNQMFQYAFYKKHSRYEKTYLDISFFENECDVATVQELGLFSAFKYTESNIQNEHEGLSLYLEKEDAKYDVNALCERNKLFEGYWQTYRYFEDITDEIRQAFEFVDTNDRRFNDFIQSVDLDNYVSVHVRRGDYLKVPHYYGNICTIDYYKKSIDFVKQHDSECSFIFLSDDIEWVKDNLKEDKAIYISSEMFDDYQNWYDMCIMSHCKHNIVANSSFSWWGAWLNKNPDKIVVAPQRWLNIAETPDICPPEWKRISGEDDFFDNDTVGICIPAYNSPASVERLLESIAIQDYKNFFVVLCDDSVNDNVFDVVRKYEGKFKLHYLKNEKSLGPTPNTNRAIAEAKKSKPAYIKIMHHDDFFTEATSLSQFVNMLKNNPKADFAFSGSRQVSSTKAYNRHISNGELRHLLDDYRYVFWENFIGAPSAVIVRNVDVQLDDDLKWEVDADWYLRILHRNPTFEHTIAPLVGIGISESTMTAECTASRSLMDTEKIRVFEKNEFLHADPYVSLICTWVNRINAQNCVNEFLQSGKKLYIYGAGKIGTQCIEVLEGKNVKIEGIVTTSKSVDEFMGYRVLQIDELKSDLDRNYSIILALNDVNRQEVEMSGVLDGIKYIKYQDII